MPYYRCAACDLTVYSAAGYSNVAVCPDCGADLQAASPVFVGTEQRGGELDRRRQQDRTAE